MSRSSAAVSTADCAQRLSRPCEQSLRRLEIGGSEWNFALAEFKEKFEKLFHAKVAHAKVDAIAPEDFNHDVRLEWIPHDSEQTIEEVANDE